MFDEENLKQINQLQLEFKTEKKELAFTALKTKNQQQIALTKQESKLKNTIIVFSIVFGSILILFLGLIYQRFRVAKKQKTIIEQQKELVDEKQKEIIDSIKYAKRIQMALLPSKKYIEKSLSKKQK